MKLAIGLVVIIALLLVFVGYMQITGFATASKSTLTPDEVTSTPERDISVKIVRGDFVPNRITVKKDETVRLLLTSESIDEKFAAHGFSIKEFGISETIPLEETKTVTFVPDKSGTFVFFCSVYCGEGHLGQSGVLTVV